VEATKRPEPSMERVVKRPREPAGPNACERQAGLEMILLRKPTLRTLGEGRRRGQPGSNLIPATVPPG